MEPRSINSPLSEKEILSVLVAEDDQDDFYLVQKMLSHDFRRNYRILQCTSLQSCLRDIGEFKPDVLLLDLGLTDSQGLNTLNAIVKAIQTVPIIVFTGVNDEELGEQAIKAGAEDYLPKGDTSAALLNRAISYAIERHRLMFALHKEAICDALTGLPNRTAFYDRLEVLIENSSRNQTHLAVALLDLDGFKEVNDELGHRAGDDLLCQVASRLQQKLRGSDMAARYGGDEFVMLLTNFHGQDELVEVLQRKLNIINQPYRIYAQAKVQEVVIGVSIGVVSWQPGMTLQQLINQADKAMYDSKNAGRNRITAAPPIKLPDNLKHQR